MKTLSVRERQAALLVAEGKPNKLVAEQMGISVWTVKVHLKRAFSKTGARNRMQLTRLLLDGVQLVLAGMLMAAGLVAQPMLTISPVGSATVAPGAVVNFQVALTGTTGLTAPLAGVQYSVNLSGSLPPATAGTLQGTTGAAAVAAGKFLSCGTPAAVGANTICLAIGDPPAGPLNSNPMTDGVVATYSVTMPASTANGTYSIMVSNPLATDGTGTAQPLVLNPGGGMSVTVAAISPCDLNGDGATDSKDLLIAIGQALGISLCGSADITGDGKCDIRDLERIVIAAQPGGICKVGQ